VRRGNSANTAKAEGKVTEKQEKFSIRLNRLASYSIKLIEGPSTLAFSHEK